MQTQGLNILALLREVCDPRPPVQLGAEGAMIRERGLRWVGNPADLEALEAVLRLTGESAVSVTALAVGPARLDGLLRQAVALGAERAVRVWDHDFAGADAAAEGALFARLLTILKPDLLVTGSALLDSGDALAPALAAAALDRPYATAAVEMRLRESGVEVLRKADRGGRERVALPLPCAVTFAPGFREVRHPDLEAVYAALDAEVEVWGLPELGLPAAAVGEQAALLPRIGYAFPRPTPLRVATPDANLSGFDRVITLLSGGIQPREGKMHFDEAEEVAGKLFHLLCAEGLVPGVEA